MTVAPATLTQMISSTRFEETRNAVVARLKDLLRGVSIVAHPGRLDMNEYLDKTIVTAPGVAVGWSRMRSARDLGGTYGLPVDWVAYVIAEDVADTRAQRRIGRDVVAYAIGTRLLRILSDPETASWGLTGITAPLPEPEPEMRPVFTLKTAENAASLYVVSWTQALLLEGEPLFDGPSPAAHGLPDGFCFDLPEGDVPAELLAVMREGAEP